MEKTTVKEAVEILRQLSPANQAHFMQLVRMADQAERKIRILDGQVSEVVR